MSVNYVWSCAAAVLLAGCASPRLGQIQVSADGSHSSIEGLDRTTPIILLVPPGARMSTLRPVLEAMVRGGCCNITLEVSGSRAVLPIPKDRGESVRLIDGSEEIDLVEHQDVLEITARVEPGGAIRVFGTVFTREYAYFPEKPGDAVPDRTWNHEHPKFGVWTKEVLQEFMKRPDVALSQPYVGLDLEWTDSVADVVRCLSSLRSAAGRRVCPNLKAN